MSEFVDMSGNLSAIILFWLWWALLSVLDVISAKNRAGTAGSKDVKECTDRIDPACCERIRRIDPSFDEGYFLQKASRAYEIILEAYAAGSLDTLHTLLESEVLTAFEHAITDRESRGETLELTFIGIRDARIVDAEGAKGGAAISVSFTAEIVIATRSPDGKIVHGDPERVVETRDLWTFGPDPASTNQSWLVTATDSA